VFDAKFRSFESISIGNGATGSSSSRTAWLRKHTWWNMVTIGALHVLCHVFFMSKNGFMLQPTVLQAICACLIVLLDSLAPGGSSRFSFSWWGPVQ
jgi:hypothetical protein